MAFVSRESGRMAPLLFGAQADDLLSAQSYRWIHTHRTARGNCSRAECDGRYTDGGGGHHERCWSFDAEQHGLRETPQSQGGCASRNDASNSNPADLAEDQARDTNRIRAKRHPDTGDPRLRRPRIGWRQPPEPGSSLIFLLLP